MSAPNSRKRAAPGSAPMVPMNHQMPQAYTDGNVANDQLLRWQQAGDAASFLDQPGQGANAFGLVPGPQQIMQAMPSTSSSLTRRQPNQALVATHPNTNFDNDGWGGFGDDGALLQQGNMEELAETDNVDLLEEMASKAKRDSQSKRKQIPPFVQKLSSFLEEQKNTDLIRWSEKGDSFVVLDEDEFAKTLIPELFKHNNYASFVRQLNMYGFHKRVGLSDNSMRASERKNKSPSEYSNPFFRRGHPNLLWLINKPKSKSKKGKSNDEPDSEEEIGHEEVLPQSLGNASIPAGRSLPPAESQPLQKKEMTLIREELRQMRDQQKIILASINRLQRNNNDLYNQALMFQNQHDRHQNSINAILNFLANVFRKTLEDGGSGQNVNDLITSMLTNQGQQSAHQGSVVDLGDFFQNQEAPSPFGTTKRARGLLPPIPDYDNRTQSRSPSASNTPYQPLAHHNPEMGHVTELVDGSPAESSPSLRQELESNPQERMMKIINDHNATNQAGMDLPEAAELVANAPNALSNDQRSQLMNFMSAQQGSNTGSTPPANPGPSASTTTPSKPTENTNTSLSPILRSPPIPPPSLHDISHNSNDLNRLQRLQSEQSAKINELNEMLGPLSPSGHIPGLNETDPYFDAPPTEFDNFFNNDAFLQDASFGADGNDFNFNLDPDGAGHGFDKGLGVGGKAGDEPSPAVTEEVERDDLDDPAGFDRGNKRQRRD